jgi:hypothetical protein
VHSPTDSRTDEGEVEVQRLGRAGLAWRLAALAAGVYLVSYGTFLGNDVQWPFAPMSQFAFRVGRDDSIRSLYLQARTATGEIITVPLNPPSIGIGRAEVEGQLPRIQRDPTMLRELVDPYPRLHPGRPALTQVWLRQRVTILKDGRAAGVENRTVVGWPQNSPGGDPADGPVPGAIR